MSRSTPVMKTRCSVCLKVRPLGDFNPVPSGDIISHDNQGYPILKCPKCGYMWVSKSRIGVMLKRQYERKVSRERAIATQPAANAGEEGS